MDKATEKRLDAATMPGRLTRINAFWRKWDNGVGPLLSLDTVQSHDLSPRERQALEDLFEPEDWYCNECVTVEALLEQEMEKNECLEEDKKRLNDAMNAAFSILADPGEDIQEALGAARFILERAR